MLSSLFGSVARVKILNLLLLHPSKQYEVAALAKSLQLGLASVRKEVKSLLDFGLLREEGLVEIISAKDSKLASKHAAINHHAKIYFSVNEGFLLYPEIRALFLKAQILFSQNFILGLSQIAQLKFLALTGFFTNYAEAQTDILIVGSVKRPAFNKLLSSLEKDLGREINYTILSEKEFFYRRSVMDIFLYNILTGKILVLMDKLPEIKKI